MALHEVAVRHLLLPRLATKHGPGSFKLEWLLPPRAPLMPGRIGGAPRPGRPETNRLQEGPCFFAGCGCMSSYIRFSKLRLPAEIHTFFLRLVLVIPGTLQKSPRFETRPIQGKKQRNHVAITLPVPTSHVGAVDA